jgi:hypothetical protein
MTAVRITSCHEWRMWLPVHRWPMVTQNAGPASAALEVQHHLHQREIQHGNVIAVRPPPPEPVPRSGADLVFISFIIHSN